MVSKFPWYPSIHDIQVSMVSKYPDIRKKWYPLIPNSSTILSSFKIVFIFNNISADFVLVSVDFIENYHNFERTEDRAILWTDFSDVFCSRFHLFFL